MAKSAKVLWGYTDVAAHCNVTAAVVRQWKTRGKIVDPDFVVSGSSAWWPATIEKWWGAQ